MSVQSTTTTASRSRLALFTGFPRSWPRPESWGGERLDGDVAGVLSGTLAQASILGAKINPPRGFAGIYFAVAYSGCERRERREHRKRRYTMNA